MHKNNQYRDDLDEKNSPAIESFEARSVIERARIRSGLTKEDKIKLFRGMILTRAVDNAFKQLFLSGEITYQGRGFQGKGFRSLGQEAIYGAMLKLHVGTPCIAADGVYDGDIAAPLIRDLGVFLAMSNDDVECAINAQAGKVGLPCNGRDLHLGDFSRGIVTPAAPLAIATCTLLGLALSFKLKKNPRVAISFIGEGGSSLGEWHEAINFAAVMKLPMVFCIENNQTALSTPVSSQTRSRHFADKALGYGINSLIVDGNDVEAVTSAFKFAADEARAGQGPLLIELITMRMCGHAHHDDMLYLGQDPALSFEIEPLKSGGYADAELYSAWRAKDPINRYQEKLVAEGVISSDIASEIKDAAIANVKKAVNAVSARDWPQFTQADEALVWKSPWVWPKKIAAKQERHFSSDGQTYLQAIAHGVKKAFQTYSNCYVIGEDVAPPYGNAFMMFKGLGEFSDRFINTPISENAIVGACVGMAQGGLLPIGEIQFNDFIACAMDQVANNAAKSFFRLEQNLPLVLRMPYGGLRRAGPYHSQDTSPWFYRVQGLKIMAPSNPQDAFSMLLKAVADPDPVLFYEHIALYRDPKIKQQLTNLGEAIEGAALVALGNDLTIVSYGAYVHVAERAADALFRETGHCADVIDLRYLKPIDFDTIYTSIKKTSRVLLVGEDAKTGGILESIASRIGQELFTHLDAPVTVLGARELPVPYAPSLEDDFLVSEQKIVAEAIKLIAF